MNLYDENLKVDIGSYHIQDNLLVKDINDIVLNQTTFSTLEEEIELNYIYQISEYFVSNSMWSIPLSYSDLSFTWSVNGEGRVIDEVPQNLTMSVQASSNSTRIKGYDEYQFIITEDNLQRHNVGNNHIYRTLSYVLIVVIIIGVISLGLSKLFRREG